MKKKKTTKKAPPRKKTKTVKKKPTRTHVKISKKSTKAKPAKKKPAKKKTPRVAKAPKPAVVAPPNSRLLGRVEDYFAKIGVVALTLKASVSVGAHLHIMGHTTNFEQTLDSIQIDHVSVTSGKIGDPVGIKVTARARGGDYVYLILS